MISEAFYFGKNQTIFGHYTPAIGIPSGKSVLIVPSIFGEAIRSHRVTREVTKLLSNKGYDVLRFDLDGDGNSLSETKKVNVEDWIENIQYAYKELLSRSTATKASVLAIRFGAGFSLLALNEYEVESYVLWDPILSRSEMHEICFGNSMEENQEEETIYNMFEQPAVTDGFFESGIDASFPDQFLELSEIKIPDNNLVVVSTVSNILQTSAVHNSSICSVDHKCDWQKKDLPVIFAPKLISTLGEYF